MRPPRPPTTREHGASVGAEALGGGGRGDTGGARGPPSTPSRPAVTDGGGATPRRERRRSSLTGAHVASTRAAPSLVRLESLTKGGTRWLLRWSLASLVAGILLTLSDSLRLTTTSLPAVAQKCAAATELGSADPWRQLIDATSNRSSAFFTGCYVPSSPPTSPDANVTRFYGFVRGLTSLSGQLALGLGLKNITVRDTPDPQHALQAIVRLTAAVEGGRLVDNEDKTRFVWRPVSTANNSVALTCPVAGCDPPVGLFSSIDYGAGGFDSYRMAVDLRGVALPRVATSQTWVFSYETGSLRAWDFSVRTLLCIMTLVCTAAFLWQTCQCRTRAHAVRRRGAPRCPSPWRCVRHALLPHDTKLPRDAAANGRGAGVLTGDRRDVAQSARPGAAYVVATARGCCVALLIPALLCYQNPVSIATSLLDSESVGVSAEVASDVLQGLSWAGLVTFWLCIVDVLGGYSVLSDLLCGTLLLAGVAGIKVTSHPRLYFDTWMPELWLITAVAAAFVAAVVLAVVLFVVKVRRIGRSLHQQPYVPTRCQQLLFRMISTQVGVVGLFVVAVNVLPLVQFFAATTAAADAGAPTSATSSVAHAVHSLLNGPQTLGELVILSVYTWTILFCLMPPRFAVDSTDTAARLMRLRTSDLSSARDTLSGTDAAALASFPLDISCWLFDLAWFAYYDPPDARETPSSFGSMSPPHGFAVDATVADDSLDVYAAVLRSGRRVVVAFRGSSSTKNYVSDLRFRRGVFAFNGVEQALDALPVVRYALPLVHRGFSQAYAALRAPLMTAVSEALERAGPESRLYVTGHSLGAAMACLSGPDFAGLLAQRRRSQLAATRAAALPSMKRSRGGHVLTGGGGAAGSFDGDGAAVPAAVVVPVTVGDTTPLLAPSTTGVSRKMSYDSAASDSGGRGRGASSAIGDGERNGSDAAVAIAGMSAALAADSDDAGDDHGAPAARKRSRSRSRSRSDSGSGIRDVPLRRSRSTEALPVHFRLRPHLLSPRAASYLDGLGGDTESKGADATAGTDAVGRDAAHGVPSSKFGRRRSLSAGEGALTQALLPHDGDGGAGDSGRGGGAADAGAGADGVLAGVVHGVRNVGAAVAGMATTVVHDVVQEVGEAIGTQLPTADGADWLGDAGEVDAAQEADQGVGVTPPLALEDEIQHAGDRADGPVIVTFGGPRVGNHTFALLHRRLVPHYWRVNFEGDLVTGLPKFLFLFKHAGTEVELDAFGNVLVAPTDIEKLFRSRSRRRYKSHLMSSYRDGLRAARVAQGLPPSDVKLVHTPFTPSGDGAASKGSNVRVDDDASGRMSNTVVAGHGGDGHDSSHGSHGDESKAT